MTRLEVLKAEKEQIKSLHCLSFGLIDDCIEWYDKEIEAIVIHGADNKFYGQQADDSHQTDMDDACEQAKSELMQIYMSLSEEKKQALDVLMAQAELQAHVIQSALDNGTNTVIATGGTQADGDLISRQAAIKSIEERAKRIKNEDTLNGLAGAVGILFELPSVKPQEPPKQECKKCKHYPDNDETCLECEYEGITRGYTRYEQEPAYCDRNICLKNEYNNIGCDECEVGNPCLYCKHEFEPQERSEE